MHLAVYSDGRPLTFDEAAKQFAIGGAPVSAEQVRGYDAAGQLAWASPELRAWFQQTFVPQPIGPQAPAPRKRKTGLVIALVALGLMAVCGVLVVASGGKTPTTTPEGRMAPAATPTPAKGAQADAAQQKPRPKVGQSFKTDKLETTIIAVETKSSVGSEFLQTKPAEGGIYVTVRWKYKNTTDKPIGTFSQPTLKLVDAAGTEYDADLGASASYATELKLTEKVLSDLNPGITVTGAKVFEVAKDSFDMKTWSILVNAGEPVKVSLQ